MANRFFTDFTGNGTTYIGLPSYTGSITYKCFPRVNNTGLPNSPTVVLNQWNTFTTSVTALTEIGRSFNGIIADISGTGLNIPVALASGIESPATLNGAGYSQYECEELNYGDWVKVDNRFTPVTTIIESGTATGFPAGLTFNNLTANRQYYIDVNFQVVDGAGDPLEAVIPYNRYIYKIGSLNTYQHDNGKFSIGSAYYPITTASASHYIQILSTTTQRVKITARISEVMKQPRVATNYLRILGNGQSLSIGTSNGTLTDAAHILPVRDDHTHWMAGNSRTTARGQGITTSYQHMRPWTESKAAQTHVHAMLSQIDSFMPVGWNTWTINEGVGGQTIDAMTSYASANAGVAISEFTATTLPVATERDVAVIVHGEANSADYVTYATKLGVLHDNYAAEVLVRRPSSAGTDMVLDQTGGNAAYWNVAVKSWEYSLSRSDVFLSGPKYHINYRWPSVPGVDTVHLNGHGYDVQGEYLAKALRNAAWGDRQWKPFQPKAAYPSAGNTFTVEFDVPVLPIVHDTTTVPAATGNGVGYVISGGATLVPSSFSISGNKIIFTISQPAAIGDKVQFGNNNTSTFNIINFRDSDSEVGEVSGETLHNWLTLSEFTLTDAPAPAASISDIDSDGEISDGQGTATLEVTGFTGDITSVTIDDGTYTTPNLLVGGTGTSYTWSTTDISNQVGDSTSGQPNWFTGTLTLGASDGIDSAEDTVVWNPASGWDVVTLSGNTAGIGSISETREGGAYQDDSVAYFDSTKCSITTDGLISTSETTNFVLYVWDSATGTIEEITVVVETTTSGDLLTTLFYNKVKQSVFKTVKQSTTFSVKR